MWSRHLVLNRAYTSGSDGTCWLFIPNRAGWECKRKPWRVHYLLKGRAGEANMLLEKPQRSFSHKLAQERVPYPPQCPVKARSLPTIHRATQKILMVMDGAVYFSLLREGLTITEIIMLRQQTCPGMSWVPLLVVPLWVPPQYTFLCTHKCLCRSVICQ